MNPPNPESTVNTWLAPAKINLFLHILGKREDGYHELQSVIQFIDLCDELVFKTHEGKSISCETAVDINEQENLVLLAAKLLQDTTNTDQGAHILLAKIIPMGAGLGGGSSNAATTLLALNHLWGCGLSNTELIELAIQLGADVPVFVRGQTCWVEGKGDVLSPLDVLEHWYLIVFPNVRMSTAHMFTNPDLTRNCTPMKIRDFSKLNDWYLHTQNVFETIARKHPQIEQAFQWLSEYTKPHLTGSGSALFGKFASQAEAENVAANCPKEFTVHVTKSMNRSPIFSLNDENQV